MRRFTFIAFSMRKVLTHPVFLWRGVCHTITWKAGSSRKAIYRLQFSTRISPQIIKGEWICNLCLHMNNPYAEQPRNGCSAWSIVHLFLLIEALTLNDSPAGGQTCLLGERPDGSFIISAPLCPNCFEAEVKISIESFMQKLVAKQTESIRLFYIYIYKNNLFKMGSVSRVRW